VGTNADRPDADVFAQLVGPLERQVRWRFRIACCEAWAVAPVAALVALFVVAAVAGFWAVAGDTVMTMPSMRPRA
jgi:hypothetical protein